MNRYRVKVSLGAIRMEYAVDASSIGVAVSRALRGFARHDKAQISITTIARDICRPRVEKQAHGRLRPVM